MAKDLLSYSERQLKKAIRVSELIEVKKS